MADDPNRTLELTQLVADLKAVFGSHWFGASVLDLIAEKLYDRGVRSKLHVQWLAEFAGTWLPVVSDPATGGAKSFGFLRVLGDGAGVDVVLALDTKLVPSGFAQMSEVPGHVDQAPAVPERSLPEGVQRVIQFVRHRRASGLGELVASITEFGSSSTKTLQLADLEVVLAEIPDVAEAGAARYPTIWAYEQACRTIRERDARIEKALELADRVEEQLGDEVPGSLDELRMTLRLRMPRTVPRCPSCEHLVSSHYEDGSGCDVTIRDVGMGADNHCPCTFNARSEHGVRQDERGK